ncbi:MAG TPA: hypothetical protein VJN94_02825 [Candidatus Binataceae bacterium]|nr:hypothetical protein [Candidatus Binataceae bacterium]
MPDERKPNKETDERAKDSDSITAKDCNLSAPLGNLTTSFKSFANEIISRNIKHDASQYEYNGKQSRWQKISVVSTAVLSFLTLIVLTVTLHEVARYTRAAQKANALTQQALIVASRANRVARENFEAAQRPYVGLGDRAGVIGRFQGVEKSWGYPQLALFFYNSGHTPALKFTVVMRDPQGKKIGAEFGRYRHRNGQVGICGTGVTIAPESGTAYRIPPPAVPSGTAFSQMLKDGQSFGLYGFAEYCDEFGQFHCEGFTLAYTPRSEEWNPGISIPCRTSFMSDPQPACMTITNDKNDTLLALSRCEQPEEYEQHRKREQAEAKQAKPFPIPFH